MNQIETFYGIIDSTADALRVFELCRQGKLGRVRRRLHEKERHLIRSGSVFVFDEQESGIKRWTDGRLWSPSRILGNFLIYRELDKKGPTGSGSGSIQSYTEGGSIFAPVAGEDQEGGELLTRKRVLSSNPSVLAASTDGLSFLEQPAVGSADGLSSFASASTMQYTSQLSNVGGFKKFSFCKNGLIKKTISITIDKHIHHLICYYTKRDFEASALLDVEKESRETVARLANELQMVAIGDDLLHNQSFRKPGAEDIYKKSSLLDDNETDQESFQHRRAISPPVLASARITPAAKLLRTSLGNAVGFGRIMQGTVGKGIQGHEESVNGNGLRYNLQGSNFQLAPHSHSQPALYPASLHPINGHSNTLYQGILQPAGELNGTAGSSTNGFASKPPTKGTVNEAVLSEIESEFGHIAATLSKLTSNTFSSPSEAAFPPVATGILPPITGESYTGSLPSLNLMGAGPTEHEALSFSLSDPQLAVNFNEQQSNASSNFALPATQQSDLSQLLSMPLFPRETSQEAVNEFNGNEQATSRMNALSLAASVEKQRRYEETLKKILFQAECN